MNLTELQLRVKLLNGEYQNNGLVEHEVDLNEEQSPAVDTASYPDSNGENEEQELSEDIFSAWRKKTNILYSKSDMNVGIREPLKKNSSKKSAPAKSEKEKKNIGGTNTTKKNNIKKFNLIELAKQNDAENEFGTLELNNGEKENLDEFPLRTTLLVSDDENDDDPILSTSNKKTKSRVNRYADSDSESDSEQVRLVVSDNDTDDGEERIYDGGCGVVAAMYKRIRSDDSDSSDGKSDAQNKSKQRRRIVISDDEED